MRPKITAMLGRLFRVVALACVAVVVVWAFVHVIRRGMQEDHLGKVHLRVVQWGDEKETSEIQSIANDFAALHPGVEVEVMQTPNFDSKVLTMTAGDVPPDVFYVTDDNLSIWANQGMLYNLDRFMAEDVAKEGDAWQKDYYPFLLNWFKFDGTWEGQGPQYALPVWHTPFCMLINKDLYERAGLGPIPYDGWTWDQYELALKRISALSASKDPEKRIYGGSIGSHQYATRTMIWNHGGQIFGGPEDKDETKLLLDQPGAQAALKLIQRARWEDNTVYNPVGSGFAAQGGSGMDADLFARGQLGIYGPDGYWAMASFKKKITGPDGKLTMSMVAVPVPHVDGKRQSASVAIGWAVAARSRHPREAYELVRYLTGPQGQAKLARDGFILPVLQSVANSDDFLKQQGDPESLKVWVVCAANSRIPYWPRIKKFLGLFFDNVDRAIKYDKVSTEEAAASLSTAWEVERHAPRNLTATGPAMPWKPILATAAGTVIVLLLGAACACYFRWRQKRGWREEASGLAFISPWLVGFLVFVLGPMLVSLVLSFTQWSPLSPFEKAQWVAGSNYTQLFTTDQEFRKSLQVTFWFTVLSVPFTQITALVLALLLNAKLRTIAFFRSAYFMPSLIGGVVLAAIGKRAFDNEQGLVNAVLRPILALFHAKPPDWFGSGADEWAIPALVFMMLWGVGGSMVIYLAALKGVPQDIHESASIDGASAWHRFWKITFPMISPIVQFNLIMALIGSFKIFDVIQVMTGGGPDGATMAYAVNLYSKAFGSYLMGYASAMAWVLFGITLVVTLVVFRLMQRVMHYESLR